MLKSRTVRPEAKKSCTVWLEGERCCTFWLNRTSPSIWRVSAWALSMVSQTSGVCIGHSDLCAAASSLHHPPPLRQYATQQLAALDDRAALRRRACFAVRGILHGALHMAVHTAGVKYAYRDISFGADDERRRMVSRLLSTTGGVSWCQDSLRMLWWRRPVAPLPPAVRCCPTLETKRTTHDAQSDQLSFRLQPRVTS